MIVILRSVVNEKIVKIYELVFKFVYYVDWINFFFERAGFECVDFNIEVCF